MDVEKFKERNRLENEVEKLDRDVDSIIVEGFSDKRVMRMLGFEGKIFESAERTHEDLAEDVERGSEKVAILTDFDSHGKQQNKEIRQHLTGKVDVISSARKQFGKQLTKEGRMAVEDVAPLFEDKEEKFVDAALDRLYTFD